MTNREMLLQALENEFDDYAETESVIAYHIDCPYSGNEKTPCSWKDYPWSILDVCGPCKMEWLDKEVSE